MSEQGWRDFLAARGVEDGVVLHVELARAVSAVAREHGAVADRAATQEVQLAIAAKADTIDLDFWRVVLGYEPMDDDNGVHPLGHGSTVWMQELDEAKPLRHAMHVDVSLAREQLETRLAAALAAGGRVVAGSTTTAAGRSATAPATACASVKMGKIEVDEIRGAADAA